MWSCSKHYKCSFFIDRPCYQKFILRMSLWDFDKIDKNKVQIKFVKQKWSTMKVLEDKKLYFWAFLFNQSYPFAHSFPLCTESVFSFFRVLHFRHFSVSDPSEFNFLNFRVLIFQLSHYWKFVLPSFHCSLFKDLCFWGHPLEADRPRSK